MTNVLALMFVLFSLLLFPVATVWARITPNDIYQEKRATYQESLSKIQDPAKRQIIEQADQALNTINQTVCIRFDSDVAKMAAIIEEIKTRENITDVVVAYGRGDRPIDTAAYYINYAAEAIAFQKIQDYTPLISSQSLVAPVRTSMSNLRANLGTVQSKILRAKQELSKAIKYYEN